MITSRRLGLGVFTLLLFFAFQILLVINAQAECEALVSTSFSSLADSCSDLAENSACMADSGETSSLDDTSTFITTSSDENLQAVMMHVHANVPLAMSPQGLKYFLLGDVTVENVVDPANAFSPAEGAKVATIVGANLRSIPSTDGRVIMSAPVGTELIADGMSSDTQWLHVLSEQGMAWISRQIVNTIEGDIDALPIINNDTLTLMQSFILSTGNGDTGCGSDFPAMLYIQGPQGILANIVVNGIEVRFDSEIVLRVDENNMLHLYSIRGSANSDGISVPAGFTMAIQLSGDGTERDGAWTNLRPIGEDERGFLTGLQLLPEGILYQPVSIPTEEDVAALLASLNQASAGAGQTVVTAAGRGKVNCAGFQPTFPLDALTPGVAPFYWDGAPGADAYSINFFDVGGAPIGNFVIDAFNPTYQVDPGSVVGDRGQFAWSVDALIGGQVACSTGRVTVLRVAGSAPVSNNNNTTDNEPKPKATKCKWGAC